MRFSLAAAALVPVMSASAANILVQVGAGGKLAFSPSNITAQVGDVIAFQFQAKNHSVTQSTFPSPCQIQTTPAQGIDSGFQFVAPNATSLPQWSFTVDNTSTPLWFFCAQTGHCEQGMVFSVNANETSPKSFAAFQASAMGAGGAAAAGAAAGSAAGSAIGAATSAIGAGVGDATSAIAGAAGAAATDAANALSGAAAAATGLANALTGGGASPTGATNGTNGTTPNAAGRTSTSTMSLVAVLGLTAGLLL
ncbi:hypothetical protein B0H16DRAFT_1362595 [Mycena metata]|uniref:Phytocyanin domain-containing protein n=1 Tax=Mycena metata TaxID=1033252 RepID=A0AAD7JZH9_9AGAR|nr:hypothetical protein B0H16DRAFT_1362595 [Mycena metata]